MPPVRSRSRSHRVAILRVDARLDPRVRNSHRAPRIREPLRELDFEPRLLVPARAHSGQDIAGQQA